MRDSGTIYFIAGMMFGGMIGATIALLLPEEQAEQARVKIKETGEALWQKSLTTLDKLQKEELKPMVNKVTNKVKSKVAEFKGE